MTAIIALTRRVRASWPWLICAAGMVIALQAAWIPVKAQVAQIMLEDAFSRSLTAGAARKPWPWADTAPLGKVTAHRLGVSEIVLSGASGEAMAFGPAAIVDGGPSGVTILAAHRDTHFRFVKDLKAGDELSLQRVDGRTARYRVAGFQTVRWDEFGYPANAPGGLLALATCYPFGTDTPGPLRRIVWAELLN